MSWTGQRDAEAFDLVAQGQPHERGGAAPRVAASLGKRRPW